MALTNGLVVMTPTSVAKTGASSTATINADGSVTFGSCETLSLNGVFTSAYDNYMIAMRLHSTTTAEMRIRFRVSGSDNSTASSYIDQALVAGSTTVVANRSTATNGRAFYTIGTQRSGGSIFCYGPNIAQPTAYRVVSVADENSAYFWDIAGTHNQSTAYDGLSFIRAEGTATFTGLVTVFGFNQ